MNSKPIIMKPEIETAADEIIKLLKAEHVIIQRYDANSGSLYLKLDYGVANSIRIADHPGKAHLKYRYNLISGIQEPYSQLDKFPRFYWPIDQVKACANMILQERRNKQAKFGHHYDRFMAQNKEDHADDRGFWRTARII